MGTLSDDEAITLLQDLRDHLRQARVETREAATAVGAAATALNRLSLGLMLHAAKQDRQVAVTDAVQRAQTRASRRDDDST